MGRPRKLSHPEAVVSLYGSVSIEKGYCKDCESTAFILQGKFACCNRMAFEVPVKFRREIESPYKRKRPSKKEQERILSDQGGRCLYCGITFDTLRIRWGKQLVYVRLVWDHMVPFSHSQDNSVSNFAAACHVCNALKGAKFFDDVETARIYLAGRRRSKGYDF